jgi:hypothetical protein
MLLLGNGPLGGACAGCTCAPAPTTCSGNLFVYHGASCLLDLTGTAGDPKFVDSAQPCGPRPYADPVVVGARLGPLMPRQLGPCAAQGMPMRPPPRWTNQSRFCGAQRGAGCPLGQVCLPRPPPTAPGPRICTIIPGNVMCPVGTVRSATDWFTDFNDTRSCTPCACGAATGASCLGIRAQLGPQGLCEVPGSVTVGQGPPTCFSVDRNQTNPGVRLVGQPTAATCAPRTDTSGTVQAAGPQTICCSP